MRRQDRRVMIRFYETPENLSLTDHQHLNQDFKPTALALYKPIIKDRDVIVRFDYTDDIEYLNLNIILNDLKLIYESFVEGMEENVGRKVSRDITPEQEKKLRDLNMQQAKRVKTIFGV